VLREPAYDKHRLGLARWLVRAGRYDEAADQLKVVGNVGVGDDDVAAVRGELVLAQSELPVTRQGHMLYAELYISGTLVRMLVDTGASRTGLRTAVLRRVGSTDLGRTVQVRTAGGVVSAGLHRVQNLALGEMRLEQLEVLALDTLPGGVDGLLGMDVLGAYPRLDL
jgi:clan AA aspartic protease (TIGR02281 family)